MKQSMRSAAALLAVMIVAAASVARAQIGTAFTYQGALEDGGAPANGNYDMIFNLWDSETGGATVGNPSAITFSGATPNGTVTVTGGLFRVTLDFGVTAFDGNPRWLDFFVRAEDPTDAAPYFPLDPRVALLPVPYAIRAESAATADDVDDADADPANELQGIGEVLGVGNDAGGADLFGLDELRADNVSSSGNLLRLSGRGGGVNVFMDEDGGSSDAFRVYDTGTEVFRILGNTGQVGINMGAMGLTTTLNLGGAAGVDGIRFPDATVQTTAFGGSIDDADADPANELQDLAGVLAQGNDAGGVNAVNFGNVAIGQAGNNNSRLRVTGPIRMGSETGTTWGGGDTAAGGSLTYEGIVTRRIVSIQNTDGHIMARDEDLMLQRDGTNGGMKVVWGATTSSVLTMRGYTISRTGVMTPFNLEALNAFGGGTQQLFVDADNIVHLDLVMGNFNNLEHYTHVTLDRSNFLPGAARWLGLVHSSWNQ